MLLFAAGIALGLLIGAPLGVIFDRFVLRPSVDWLATLRRRNGDC